MAVTPIKIMGAYTLINDIVGASDTAYSVDKISTDVINDNDIVMTEHEGGMYFYNAVTYPFEITVGDDLPYYIKPNDETGFQRWTLMKLYGDGVSTDSLSANNGSIITIYHDVNILNNLYANYTGTVGLSAVSATMGDLTVYNGLTVIGDAQIAGKLRGDIYASDNTFKVLDNGIDGTDVQLNALGITGTAIKDEDDMISNSDVHLATQQSIKAYVDSGTINMTNKTLTSSILNTSVSGTAVLDEDDMISNSDVHLATQQSIKAYVDSGTITMTNKTLTSPVINTQITGTAIKDEDNMASNSDVHLATQQSIKAYIDSKVSTSSPFSTWQGEVSKSKDVLYTNNTGKVMAVHVSFHDAACSPFYAYMYAYVNRGSGLTLVDNNLAVNWGCQWEYTSHLIFYVPPGATYKVTGSGSYAQIEKWNEAY
jgi:hypothetical protein